MKRNLVFLTGNGASIDFGMPKTDEFTDQIGQNIAAELSVLVPLYDEIVASLKDYYRRPGNVDFEQIYHAIDRVYQFLNLPGEDAVDKNKPIDGALLRLKEEFIKYDPNHSASLRRIFLRYIVNITYDATKTADVTSIMKLFSKLAPDYNIISGTLNYDDLLDRALELSVGDFLTGFPQTDPQPRAYNREAFLGGVKTPKHVHLHLHGSIRWGWPRGGDGNIHEYSDAKDAIETVMGHSSGGSHKQSGENVQDSTIITGLGKVEELFFDQPFYDYVWAFGQLCANADEIVIAGYGFRDHHIHKALEQFRWNNPKTPKVYLVDYNKDANSEGFHPYDWFNEMLFKKHITVNWILGAETVAPRDFKNNRSGWWTVPGAGLANTPEMYVWLGGFSSFCEDVATNGLP